MKDRVLTYEVKGLPKPPALPLIGRLSGPGALSGAVGSGSVGGADATAKPDQHDVRTKWRNRGIGAQLLSHLRGLTKDCILIGTWADAVWAIRFYEKHGFRMVGLAEKDRLLRKYWKISVRQRERSVALADAKWRGIDV